MKIFSFTSVDIVNDISDGHFLALFPHQLDGKFVYVTLQKLFTTGQLIAKGFGQARR